MSLTEAGPHSCWPGAVLTSGKQWQADEGQRENGSIGPKTPMHVNIMTGIIIDVIDKNWVLFAV